MKLTSLNEKAMLVKLTRRTVRLTNRDAEAEARIQEELNDDSLVVNSRLFRDRNNAINKVISLSGAVYTYHRAHTLPYMDNGPRILPNAHYMEYAAAMRNLIQELDTALANHMPYYDKYVQDDILYRSKRKQGSSEPVRAKVEDYPTAQQFSHQMSCDLQFRPLPDSSHWLFDVSEEDKAAFEASLVETAKLAQSDAVRRMLVPMQHLASKLSKPIGSENSIFRDSAVENIVESVNLAKSLIIDDSPEVTDLISQVEGFVSEYAGKINWLRESPINREAAAAKLVEVEQKLQDYMKYGV